MSASTGRRVRIPHSCAYWLMIALPGGGLILFLVHQWLDDWATAQAVAGLFSLLVAKTMEIPLGWELRLVQMQTIWRDQLDKEFPQSATFKTVWADAELQKKLRIGAYVIDTDSFMNAVSSSNLLGMVIGMFAGFAAVANKLGTVSIGAPSLAVPTVVLGLLGPVISMWAPAFHFVRRNNDLMQ